MHTAFLTSPRARTVRLASTLARIARLASLLAAALLCTAGLVHAAEVTFLFPAPPGAERVSLAGSFNSWSIGTHPLEDPDGDGIWSITLDLSAGPHQYKFVVDGDHWIIDESAADFADDGFGGKNSVILVGSDAIAAGPAEGAPAGPGTLVRFRFRPGEPAKLVTVAGTFNEWNSLATPLADGDGDGVWETALRLVPGTYQYKFVVGGSQWHTDEFAGSFVPDGFGGRNSVLKVGAQAMIAGEPMGGAVVPQGVEVVFRFAAPDGINAVSVAGSFNDWDAAADPLSDDDGDGIWEAALRLPPGRHAYQFVLDGDDWVSDPHGQGFEEDGFGGRHALLEVASAPLRVGAP